MCYSVIYKNTVSETPEELIKNLGLEKSELVVNDSYSKEITMDSCLCQINIPDTLASKYDTRMSGNYFDFIATKKKFIHLKTGSEKRNFPHLFTIRKCCGGEYYELLAAN